MSERTAVRDLDALLDGLSARLRALAPDDAPPAVPGYVPDAKGRLVNEKHVRPAEALEDQTVRRILAYGVDLADQIARFRSHTTADLLGLLDVLAAEYGQTARVGQKGNWSVSSFDGRLKVVVQVSEQIAFGPELQVARGLVSACITDWSDGARSEIVELARRAFEPDKAGRINREAVLRLRRVEIDDPRWRQAQRAIGDAIRVVGSRRYLRLYMRGAPDAAWIPVPIDLASNWMDPNHPAAAAAAARAKPDEAKPDEEEKR